MAKIMEEMCILLIWRWKRNIKKDVDEFNKEA